MAGGGPGPEEEAALVDQPPSAADILAGQACIHRSAIRPRRGRNMRPPRGGANRRHPLVRPRHYVPMCVQVMAPGVFPAVIRPDPLPPQRRTIALPARKSVV